MNSRGAISYNQIVYLNDNFDLVGEYAAHVGDVCGKVIAVTYKISSEGVNDYARVYVYGLNSYLFDYDWCDLLRFIKDRNNNVAPIFK